MARQRRIPKRKGGRFKFLDKPSLKTKGGKKGDRAVGGDFWSDVGNFFTHTLPEIAQVAMPIILSVL